MNKARSWKQIALAAALAAALPAVCLAANWGPETELTPWTWGDSWTTANNACNLATSNDTIYFVWHDYQNSPGNYGCWLYFKFYDGQNWSQDTTIGKFHFRARYKNWYPSSVVDQLGKLHVVWESNEVNIATNINNFDIVYLTRYNNTWSSPYKLTDDQGLSWHPDIVCGNNNRLYVFWQDNRQGTFKIFYKSYDGAAWSQDACLNDLCLAAGFPSAAATGGYPAVAWQDFRTGINQVFFRMSTAAGWGADSSISGSPTGAFTPCLVSDGGGNLHLVWEDWRDGNGEIYYRRLDQASATWGSVQRLTADPGHSRGPVLACRGDTLVDVFWADDRDGNYEIYTLQCHSGIWGSEQRLTHQDANSQNPNIVADARGNMHLAWTDFRGGPPYAPNIFFMSDIENLWPKGDTAGKPEGPAIRVFTVWPNPAGNRACFDFSADGLDCPGPGQLRIYNVTGQAVAALDVPAVRRGAGQVAWDCRDRKGKTVATGVYLARLSVGGATSCRRFLVVR